MLLKYYFLYTLGEHDGSGMIISENLFSNLNDLEPWNNYSISVAASTRAGEGAISDPLICTTLEDGNLFHMLFL